MTPAATTQLASSRSSTCSSRSVTRIGSRPAGLDARFDRGADVVRVHVAVPDARRRRRRRSSRRSRSTRPEAADRRVGRVEEVHDLVAQPRHVVTARGAPRRDAGVVHDLGLGDRPAVDDFEQRVEQQREPVTARVDHAGLARARAGDRACQRRPRAPRSTARPARSTSVAARASRLLDGLGRRRATTVRIVPSTGRSTAWYAASAAPAQRRGRDRRRRRSSSVAEHVGEAAQDLREDDARVAARAHERTPADRLADLGHRLGGAELARTPTRA